MMRFQQNILWTRSLAAGVEQRLKEGLLHALGFVPRHPPIGCALTERSVRLMQLCPGENRLISARVEFEGTTSKTGPDLQRQIAAALRVALADAPFIGRHIVTCLPSERVVYRRMLMAPMPDEELSQSIYWQIAKEIGHEPSDQCTDYFDTGMTTSLGKDRREVIAVSASLDDLRDHLAPLQDVGLIPFAVDTNSGALARSLTTLGSSGHSDGYRLLVNLGPVSSTLIVTHNACPHFIYTLPQVQFSPEMDDRERRHMTSDLIHGILLCAHYLEERDGGSLLPDCGCIVGAGEMEFEIASELNMASPIPFRSIADSISPELRLHLHNLQEGFTVDEFLVPLGLALYGYEETYLEAAA